MKTVLFLHRLELTHLFSGISKELENRMNIIHVAYSDEEEKFLRNLGIIPDYNYRELLSDALKDQTIIDQKVLDDIDTLFIKITNGRFNLNSSIQSDRGFSLLSYEEVLLLVQAIYSVWMKIFNEQKIDIFIHESCSLFFNHLAAVLCKNQGGIYLWYIMLSGEDEKMYYANITNDDFSCPEIEEKMRYYLNNPNKIDYERCRRFIQKFRSSYDVFMGGIAPPNGLFYWGIRSIKTWFYNKINEKKYDKLIDNIDYWLVHENIPYEKVYNLKKYKEKRISFEEPIKGEKYYYYSFHLEPEAVVSYLGDGIYANQVKLIENIAASLPVGYYLYVKDHPHEFAYRNVDDYLRLMEIPNVRLIRTSIPGKSLIKNSIGVFSINGTAGFEALMLQKQVYCFGKSYYTNFSRVNYIHNIRDLRNILYANINEVYTDDDEFMAFVNSYLDALHLGMVDFFMGRAENYNIDFDLNARRIANDLIDFSETYSI